MSKKRIKPPYRALWEITWRCDLRCEHCLVEGGTPATEELSTEQALKLADDLAELGVSAVSLTGGEPFLRKDWRQIAARVRSHGMLLRFSANGHLLDEDRIKALVDLDTESFSVSLDGIKATHDTIRHGPEGTRGTSSFDRVLAAIDLLSATPILVSVRTTVTKQNIDELPALHAILKKHRVQRWILQLGHRTGRLAAKGLCDPIEPAQLHQISEFVVENSSDPVLQPRAFNNIGYLGRTEPVLRKSGRPTKNPIWRGCQCGVNTLGIEPDGGIKGCANQVGEPFVVGNVLRESLAEIWQDRKRWHWVNPQPEQMTGECAGCALAKICGAGCTVLAYRSSKELFNQPYCLRRIEKTMGADPS